MMTTVENEMQNLHDEWLARLASCGLLDLTERYWMKRAECASRSLSTIGDADRTNIVKGQISICYETADEAKRTRESAKAKANAEDDKSISAKYGQSAV